MTDLPDLDCAHCDDHVCRQGVDCYGTADEIRALYEAADGQTLALLRAASRVESQGYLRWPRALEIIRFAEAAGLKHVGIAFCVGLAAEAREYADLLEAHGLKVSSVCCKSCGLDKQELGLPHLDPANERETMCSPLGQAELLNEAGAELNVIVGLCVGHDMVFTRHAHAPVTTLVAKDRVLAHNPVGALTSRYWRRRLRGEMGFLEPL